MSRFGVSKVKARTLLVGGLALILVSAACVQLAPIARFRVAGSESPAIEAAPRPGAAVADPGVRAAAVEGSAPASAPGRRTAVVRRGPIAEVLSLSGRVSGTDEIPLTFSAGGRLQTVAVKPGQAVEQGEILAETDPRDITRDLIAARTRLETSMVRLAQSEAQSTARRTEGGRRAELDQLRGQRGVAEAEVALTRAEADLERVGAGASATEIRAAEAGVATAQATLERALAERSRLTSGADRAELLNAEQDVAAARIALQRAEDDMARLTSGAAANDVRTAEREVLTAESDLQRAQSDFDRLTSGPDPQAVRNAERDVDRAQSALRSAQSTRADSTTRATRDADVRRAEQDLQQAQDRLAALRLPPRQADVDIARNRVQSAQLAVDNARDKLERARRGPDSLTLEVGTLAVNRAKVGLENARARLATLQAGPSEAQLAAATASVESARVGVDSANTRLDEVKSHPTPTELREAQDRMALARGALNRAVIEAIGSADASDMSAYDLLLMQKGVEQDRSQVDVLERDLEATRLRAPSAGVVTGVMAATGDTVQGGRPALTFARVGDPVMQADITDREAARISVGQAAAVRVDGFDDIIFTGSVYSISERDGGLGKLVYVSLEWPTNRAAYGASGQATFTVNERENSLIVPERAVRSNGARRYVEYMEGSSRRMTDVEVGITGGGFVEIVKGLSEGQVVLVRS